MNQFEKFAEVIRKFGSVDFLAYSIENITVDQARDIDTLEDLICFLEDELQYANE